MRHIAISVLLFACTTDSGDLEAPTDKPVELGGSYQLANRLDLASAGVLPDVASTTLHALSQLKEDPAGAILDLLEATHAPIVSNVLSVIPDALEQPLTQWINDNVFAALYQGVPVTQQIASIVDDLASLVTRFQVDTSLDLIEPDVTGASAATHSLAGVTFTVAEHALVVRAPDLLSDVTHGDLSASALHIVEQSPDVQNGIIELRDHSIGLPIGAYVIHGIDQLMMAKFGQPNLRAALGALVNCSSVAHNVAQKCIGPVCVGHETELRNLCDAGLDAIVTSVEAQLMALNFKALHFKHGAAAMWDAAMAGGPRDGVVDRIEDGIWNLGVDVGTGEHAVYADFTGVRSSTPAASQ